MCSPLEQVGREGERVKEREKGEPYTRIPDTDTALPMTLGARGHLPSGYIVSSLRVLKQFAQSLPSGYVVSSFKKYPPKYPLGTS